MPKLKVKRLVRFLSGSDVPIDAIYEYSERVQESFGREVQDNAGYVELGAHLIKYDYCWIIIELDLTDQEYQFLKNRGF